MIGYQTTIMVTINRNQRILIVIGFFIFMNLGPIYKQVLNRKSMFNYPSSKIFRPWVMFYRQKSDICKVRFLIKKENKLINLNPYSTLGYQKWRKIPVEGIRNSLEAFELAKMLCSELDGKEDIRMIGSCYQDMLWESFSEGDMNLCERE